MREHPMWTLYTLTIRCRGTGIVIRIRCTVRTYMTDSRIPWGHTHGRLMIISPQHNGSTRERGTRAFPNWQNQGNCPSVRHNMCISRRTTQAMIVLKGLLSPLNGAISSGQMRCYVEQGRFHGENGGCETPSGTLARITQREPPKLVTPISPFVTSYAARGYGCATAKFPTRSAVGAADAGHAWVWGAAQSARCRPAQRHAARWRTLRRPP